MDPFLFINILCSGIVLCSAVTFLIFGFKILSTRFYSLFWFVIFIYLLFYNLHTIGIKSATNISHYIHFFIPAFCALFLLVKRFEKVKIYHFSILTIPLVSSLFASNKIFALTYHIVFWGLLIIYVVKDKSVNKLKLNEDKKKSLTKFFVILTLVAVLPFIATNLIILFIFKINNVIETMIPVSVSATSVLGLFFTYHDSLLMLNHDFLINVDFLKKANAFEKKTIIEKLAASLIHELKNPISAIQSLTYQMKEKINNMSEEKTLKYLEIISSDLDKMKEISNSFLKTCRKSNDIVLTSFNLYEMIGSVGELLKYELNKKNIAYINDASNKDKIIIFDNYKFRQIILNLIYNSIEASAKKIKIYSTVDTNFIQIFLEDDGTGITEENKSRIFMPFFSTKLDGTGMGLSICKELLNEEFGNISLVSSSDGKTEFLITIKLKD